MEAGVAVVGRLEESRSSRGPPDRRRRRGSGPRRCSRRRAPSSTTKLGTAIAAIGMCAMRNPCARWDQASAPARADLRLRGRRPRDTVAPAGEVAQTLVRRRVGPGGATMQRRFVVVLVCLAVVAAACGRSDSPKGGGEHHVVHARAARPGRRRPTSARSPTCVRRARRRARPTIGVTPTQIHVATFSDAGFVGRPGLNQEFFDTADVFSKWCNDARRDQRSHDRRRQARRGAQQRAGAHGRVVPRRLRHGRRRRDVRPGRRRHAARSACSPTSPGS